VKHEAMAARITALEAENWRLRLRLLLLATDPATCTHEWAVQGTRLTTGGYSTPTWYVTLVCGRCHTEQERSVTHAWIRAYETLCAEGVPQ
jgi:hypothetical protein